MKTAERSRKTREIIMRRRVFYTGSYYVVQELVHEGWLGFKPKWFHDVETQPNFNTAEAAFAHMDYLDARDEIPVGPVSRG